MRRARTAAAACLLLVLLCSACAAAAHEAAGHQQAAPGDDGEQQQQQAQAQQAAHEQQKLENLWAWRCPRPQAAADRLGPARRLLRALLGPCPAGSAPPPRGGRALLQQAASAPAEREPAPKVVIGSFKLSVSDSYTWDVQRQSSASGVALTADSMARQQIGYTLTFTRQPPARQYALSGEVAITNPSGTAASSLVSVSVLAAGREVQVPCRGMPGTWYQLGPAQLVKCPFTLTWAADPGPGVVSGWVVTRANGRVPGDAASYNFAGCGGAASAGDAGSSAVPCAIKTTAACVQVTDGSYIFKRYTDKLGQATAGPVTRSSLFSVSSVTDTRLGPPRTEPELPPPAPPPAPQPTPDEFKTPMPDSSWYTGSRRRRLLARLLLLRPEARGAGPGDEARPPPAPASSRAAAGARAPPARSLRAADGDGSLLDAAQYDANFQWPYPQVTGDRPPVGLKGVPARASVPVSQLCDSRSFAFGMVWGPLAPSACGTYEVQNIAAALPVDGSSDAVVHSTYMYLQVLCPAGADGAVLDSTTMATFASVNARRLAAAPEPRPELDARAGPHFRSGPVQGGRLAPGRGPARSAARALLQDAPGQPPLGGAVSSDAGAAADSSPAPSPAPSPAAPAGAPEVAASLRVTVLEAAPFLVSSYNWSLANEPVKQPPPPGSPAGATDPALLGCSVRATRGAGTLSQVLLGVLRLGNPAPSTQTLRVTGITLEAALASGLTDPNQPGFISAAARVLDCAGADPSGSLTLMPRRRTNCSFELTLAAGPEPPPAGANAPAAERAGGEGQSSPAPPAPGLVSGTLVATATVEAEGASGPREVTSDPWAFSFQNSPVLLPSSGDGDAGDALANATAGAPAGPPPQRTSVGACADLSAGIVVASELVRDAAAAAAAAAAGSAVAEVSGSSSSTRVVPLDGSGGSCSHVCGPGEQVVTALAPTAGFPCGSTIQVACTGSLTPVAALGWRGAARPPILIATSQSSFTASCPGGSTPAMPGNDSSSSASGAGSSSGAAPLKLELQQVEVSRVARFTWSSRLELRDAASASTASPSGNGSSPAINLSSASASPTVALVATHVRHGTPRTGRITGRVTLSATGSGNTTVSELAVSLLLPCGGSLLALVTCPTGGAAALPAGPALLPPSSAGVTCNFELELSDMELSSFKAGVVVARAKAALAPATPATADAGAGAAPAAAVQSLPAPVVLQSAPLLEYNRCVGVNTSLSLLRASEGGGATPLALPPPTLAPGVRLPAVLCGSDTVDVVLAFGPASGTACSDVQLSVTSRLSALPAAGGSGDSSSAPAAAASSNATDPVSAAEGSWAVRLPGCA